MLCLRLNRHVDLIDCSLKVGHFQVVLSRSALSFNDRAQFAEHECQELLTIINPSLFFVGCSCTLRFIDFAI